ncbi:hypothetical protein [Synechococcus sp. CBW1107]|uniref:hypothetical protein n=1 Tax=Synechococcus sp. CBW1107 TaxID=2789857 RepID=UPI002AD2AD75|nr:hypothetical protein [Synechococcus sp. CBW1107]CAK6686826.1 hypothetical protein ICNINCKA_00079 [Synechococcus sp. CBW1107]
MLAHPAGLPVDEPWYLVSNADPSLDLVWSYAQRFCCGQLFRDQKSGIFQLESSGLREPERIDRLLLILAIAVLVSSLQGYATSLAGLRRQVDPHWQRGMSFVRIGLATLQAFVTDTKNKLMTWMPIPQRDLGPCIPSRGVQRRQLMGRITAYNPPSPSSSAYLSRALERSAIRSGQITKNLPVQYFIDLAMPGNGLRSSQTTANSSTLRIPVSSSLANSRYRCSR